MQIMNDENARLKAEAASIQSALSGMDQLKAKTGNLEIANTSLAAEKSELHKEIEVLRNSSNSLQTAESGDALRAQLDKEMAKEVETVRGELMAKHEVKVQELHQTISELEEQCGERKKEVTELTAQIDKCSSLQDQLRAIGEELTGEQTAKKVCMHVCVCVCVCVCVHVCRGYYVRMVDCQLSEMKFIFFDFSN